MSSIPYQYRRPDSKIWASPPPPVHSEGIAFSSQLEEVDRAMQRLINHGQYQYAANTSTTNNMYSVPAAVDRGVIPSTSAATAATTQVANPAIYRSFTPPGFQYQSVASVPAPIPVPQVSNTSTNYEKHTTNNGSMGSRVSPKFTFDPFAPVTTSSHHAPRMSTAQQNPAYGYGNDFSVNRNGNSRALDNHLKWSSSIWGTGSATTSVWG